MEKPKTSAKDFFLNLGAIVALYTTIISLINLLFTVINRAFPRINDYYGFSSPSISLPVATLIIFFPIYVLLMWVLERGYVAEPEKRGLSVRRWLTYITLFVAGLTLAGDLVTVLYFFLDGQELTAGFLFKVLSVFILAGMVFWYYISDVRGKTTSKSRFVWFLATCCLLLVAIIWGFAVLGSPYKQRQLKYDEQRVSDLQNINNQIVSDFQYMGSLPANYNDIGKTRNSYFTFPTDPETGKSYEYLLTGQTIKAYQLCATFNSSSTIPYYSPESFTYYFNQTWAHPSGRYCFSQSIPASMYKPVSVKTTACGESGLCDGPDSGI